MICLGRAISGEVLKREQWAGIGFYYIYTI